MSRIHSGTRFAAVAVLLAVSSGAVRADEADDAARAEARQSLLMLINKGAWDGAERAFGRLEAVGGLSAEDLNLGAHVAWSRGEVADAQERLERSLQLDRSTETLVWLREIAQGYAPVRLNVTEDAPGVLTPDELPMGLDGRQSIAAAQARLDADDAFDGLLPVGGYTLDGTFFVVSSSVPVVLLDQAHALVSRPLPAPRPRTGVVFSAGPGLTRIGAPYIDDAMQPAAFTGIGGRLTAGLERPLGGVVGSASVGYHSAFSAEDALSTLHLLVGGVGAGWHPGRLRLSAAGLGSVGVLRAVGIHDVEALNAACPAGSTAPECTWVAGIPEEDREDYLWSGLIAAPGGQVSAGAALFSPTPHTEGRLVLTGGALVDPSRLYPWAQLAVEIGPAW